MSEGKKILVIEINQVEMACRIAEAVIGARRPDGTTAASALDRLDIESKSAFLSGAAAAIKYMWECSAAASPGNTRMIAPSEISSGVERQQ